MTPSLLCPPFSYPPFEGNILPCKVYHVLGAFLYGTKRTAKIDKRHIEAANAKIGEAFKGSNTYESINVNYMFIEVIN